MTQTIELLVPKPVSRNTVLSSFLWEKREVLYRPNQRFTPHFADATYTTDDGTKRGYNVWLSIEHITDSLHDDEKRPTNSLVVCTCWDEYDAENVVGWLFNLCQEIAKVLPGCEVIEPEWSEA